MLPSPLCRLCAVALFMTFMLPSPARATGFQRRVLSEEFFSEGAAAGDIDADGHVDIVSGPFWYAGPEYRTRHAYIDLDRFPISGYSQHFFSWVHDVNRDGHVDILVVGMPGQPAVWYENPGAVGPLWQKHLALADVGNESPTFQDLTGDGEPELICMHGGALGYARPDAAAPTEPWAFTAVSDNRGYGVFTHGLGVGDVDGDGRLDLLEATGWWQQPDSGQEMFQYHPFRFAQSGASQMFAYDFDGDGDQDVLAVQNAHGYGLNWFERRGSGDQFVFVPHPILTDNPRSNPYGLAISQMHSLALVDIDGDGLKDIVTGKRFWAHGGNDPGARELPVLYWLRTQRTDQGVEFAPRLIDERVGVGTQLTVAELNGDRHPDLVIGNKLGTCVLLNEPQVPDAALPRDVPLAHPHGTALFSANIRETEPLDPELERETFVLPPGFEAQLVAAEPDIAKPMNLAFDVRGRLWVTSSEEYPYAAPENRPARDTIKILEDTNGDGRADRVTTFAEGLNIPIGLYPYRDGAICFSIPDILFLRDTDGDGRADRRERLYGPFDTSRDTHGMCNSFTRGLDGWLYACHGFNNDSTVSGRDGHTIHMQSGNTFRMRLDGSRIEHVGFGQVNPFGMTFDRWGDLLTADCHTKPINLVLPGGYHDSFGKPHDGLGYVPNVMQHLHASTGIAGVALGAGTSFPSVYQESSFGGNVVTSRVNRDTLEHHGSSLVAVEEPDFLVSGDPWFRPVDLQVGPDGALYIADFYNRIIGHYEVKLDHPGRDRFRGRIWRIVYRPGTENGTQRLSRVPQARQHVDFGEKGAGEKSAASPFPSLPGLLEQYKSPNRPRRMLAMQLLVERFGEAAVGAVRDFFQNCDVADGRVHALWTLFQLEALEAADLARAIQDGAPVVRAHGFEVLAEQSELPAQGVTWMLDGLRDPHPLVRRRAVMAAQQHPATDFVIPLLELHAATPGADVHLQHAIRMALKAQLAGENAIPLVQGRTSTDEIRLLANVCLALKTPAAGDYIAAHIGQLIDRDRGQLTEYLRFAARYVSPERVTELVDTARQRFGDDAEFQLELLESLRIGFEQRGTRLPESVRSWALSLARQLLHMGTGESGADAVPLAWHYVPYPGTPERGNPWVQSRRRASADGHQPTLLWSSFPKGEQLTGIYRSAPFTLGAAFRFYVAGHDGFPDKPLQGRNLVRLRDAQTHETLFETSPPRNDTAQPVTWQTEPFQGRKAYIELVDGDTAGAYAWLAVGRFSNERLNPSALPEDRQKAALLVGRFGLRELSEQLAAVLRNPETDRTTLSAVATALVALEPSSRRAALAELPQVAGVTEPLCREALQVLMDGDGDEAAVVEVLDRALKAASGSEQLRIAERLVQDREGLDVLLSLIEAGTASARLLTRPTVSQAVAAIGDSTQQQRAMAIVSRLPSEDAQLAQIIAARKQDYLGRVGSIRDGAELFRKHCAACHQVAGQGKQVGPNLDGIGNRGLDRLAEDVLAPNRNVDVAFRATTVVTLEGRVYSGLVRPTETDQSQSRQLILIDSQGKEIVIPTDEIDEQVKSQLSPMPANFHEQLKPDEFRDLFAYLLSLRG